MIWRQLRNCLVLVTMGAFLALSMAEAVAMPRELTGNGAGMATMNMSDCANMKMPVPCKDPNAGCLGAVCIPMISFLAPALSGPLTQEWTTSPYEGRLAIVMQGRSIAPDLGPPKFVA